MNPFPDLPVIESKDGKFYFDDRDIDYKQLDAELGAMAAEQKSEDTTSAGASPANGGAGPMDANGNDLRLSIELIDGELKRISFNSRSGLVYYVEQTANLVNWTPLQTIVADDTNEVFHAFDPGVRFFRVREGDDRIQFPDWGGVIEQFAYFDVWTSIQGTYTLELFGDGTLLYQATQPVPANGFFGVYDGNYDPSFWPFAGHYDIDEWELRVTVTPEGAGFNPAAPAQATVKKKGRRRPHNPPYAGLTVQLIGVVSDVGSAQEDVDHYMETIFVAHHQAAYQIDLDGAPLNEFTTPTPAIQGAADWTKLRTLIQDTNDLFNYFHYFGHGSKGLIGIVGVPAESITVAQLKASRLTNTPMNYTILDGCRAGENPDMLEAFIFFPKVIPVQKFLLNGWIPRFGASWDKTKRIEFLVQGTLVYRHFDFWVDYYTKLTEPNAVGFMFRTYKEAYTFAKTPMGLGVNPNTTQNDEAGGFVPQGCYECVFDW